MSDEELRRLEAKWKSDVDLKLDTILRDNEARAKKYDAFIDIMIEREKDRVAFRKAMIHKSLEMIILGAVIGLATLAWNGALGQLSQVLNAVRPNK